MPTVPGRRPDVLLELDLTSTPVEMEPDDLLGRVRTRHRARLRDVLRTLYEAGRDRHVRGLVVRVGGEVMPWATMQELRDGIRTFVGTGKPAVAWAETLGDGNGTVAYALATACTELWLQPTGELGLLGVAAETTFLRGALDKLGIEPQLDKRHEYKNAADRIMNSEFTPEHREAVDRVAASAWSWAVDTIAEARELTPARVAELADVAPLPAEDARAAGLIDRLGYRDEVYAAVRTRVGEAELLFADRWRPRRKAVTVVRPQRRTLALVEARGDIVSGRSGGGPRGRRVGSDTVCAALRAARRDEHVGAVVLRVDSPGGSAVASDTIWREVVLTRDSGKPVIASMGDVAGSGGYYIACPADVVVAQPGTITGSIGVLGGKVVVTDLLERLGLTTGAVAHGRNARMYSARMGFTESERERLGTMLDRIYADFVQKVAAGRRMSVDAVEAVARGRIWSGADAARNGLVDELGGLRHAARIARERAGLPSDAPLRPALHVPLSARLGRPRSSDDPRAMRTAIDPWHELGVALGLPTGELLRMPTLRLR